MSVPAPLKFISISIIGCFFLQALAALPALAQGNFQVKGETLYFSGKVGSDFYDFMAYEAPQLKKVRQLSLNSYGGNLDWSLAIAQKVRAYGWDTIIEEGQVCASACVFIFAAGKERKIHPSTWFGIHGARGSAGFMKQLEAECLDQSRNPGLLESTSPQCAEVLKQWHSVVVKTTREAFTLIESFGVSKSLFLHYMQFPDETDWLDALNILKKPDWVLSSSEALQYSLATGFL